MTKIMSVSVIIVLLWSSQVVYSCQYEQQINEARQRKVAEQDRQLDGLCTESQQLLAAAKKLHDKTKQSNEPEENLYNQLHSPCTDGKKLSNATQQIER